METLFRLVGDSMERKISRPPSHRGVSGIADDHWHSLQGLWQSSHRHCAYLLYRNSTVGD